MLYNYLPGKLFLPGILLYHGMSINFNTNFLKNLFTNPR